MNTRTGLAALCLLSAVLAAAPPPVAGQETECLDYVAYQHVVADLSHEARFMARQGDLVYLSSLQVVDVSLPGAPAVVGSFAGRPGTVRGMTATATHLYVIFSAADGPGFNGLAVYDLANPLSPVIVGELEVPQFMTQLRVLGNRAFVRNDQGLLLVVSLADPALPQTIGSIGQGWLDSFDLRGNLLFAVDRIRNDVVVVDVSAPGGLWIGARLPLPDTISIAFHGDYGYFLTANSGTRVLRFTGPDQYVLAAERPDLDRALVVHGERAYAYGNPLRVYDLGDPAAPAQLVTVPFVVHAGLLDGDRALLGLSTSFVEMDLSNTADLPGVVTALDLESTLTDMMNFGSFVLTFSRMGLQVHDATDCAAPALAGSLPWQEEVQGRALAGNYLYVMTAGAGVGSSVLRVIDLTDAAQPVEVASKNLSGELRGLTAVGDYLYTSEYGALIILNVSDPLDPAMYSRLDGVGFSALTALDGTDLVVADGMTLRHFDVSVSDNPVSTTTVNTGVEGLAVRLDDGVAYFAHRRGVKMYAAGSLGSKNLLGDVTVPGAVDGLAVHDGTLYVEGSGIFMFDVREPALAGFVGNLGYVADRATNLTIVGQCLYFDQYLSGDRGRLNIAHRHCLDDGGPTGAEVVIDVKPGSDRNRINCRNRRGVIPVAILTTPDFDALSVDHTTVRFGPGEAMESHWRRESVMKRHEEDVDGDGDLDLVFHFAKRQVRLECGDTEVRLTGETFDGVAFSAVDVVDTSRRHGGDDDDDDDGQGGAKGLGSGPATMSLAPNPFNPSTTISFNLPAAQQVRVEVYDLTGRRIAVVANEMFGAGGNRATWLGTDDGGRSVASGVYFVRVSGPGVALSQRALLLK